MNDHRPRVFPAVVGLALNLALVALLFGICAFDSGRGLRPDWASCVFWCGVVAMPGVLVAIGLAKQNRDPVIAGAVIALPIALISLAGATLPILIPAIAYGIAASKRRDSVGSPPLESKAR